MENKYMKGFIFFIFTALLIGCATQPKMAPTLFPAPDLNPLLQSQKYKPKVDNFVVILDGSGTMRETYGDRNKLDFAKGLVSGMNQTIPNMKLMSGLRMFGLRTPSSKDLTELLYGITTHSKMGFESGLSMVTTPRGESPLSVAMDAASKDLRPVQGQTALIIFSDGKDMDSRPVKSAKAMKELFGNRLCIYTVVIGEDPKGKEILAQVANAGECGFSVGAESIASASGMAEFVKRVFLTQENDSDSDGIVDPLDQCPDTPAGVEVDARGCPLDADGDGVYDYLDRCPETPKEVAVDVKGCPLDLDGDGVPDYLDKCPDTPRGVEVSQVGCPFDRDGDGVYDYQDKCPNTPHEATVNEVGCWVLKGVNFDLDKWDIKPQYYPILDEVVSVLQRNPSLKVEIQGHTDSQGTALYNQTLSENRAKAVMDYFVSKGIERERLTAVGYGLTKPVASNLTREGRASNRRVELQPSY